MNIHYGCLVMSWFRNKNAPSINSGYPSSSDKLLSQHVLLCVHTLFDNASEKEAEMLLRAIDAETAAGAERLQLACLKISNGSLSILEIMAKETVEGDWRDILLKAGFHDDIHAHKYWNP